MEYQSKTNGLQTFLEHNFFPVTVLIAVVVSVILGSIPWVYFFVVGIILLASGAILIAWAKWPSYRSGRFFTFGIKSVPNSLAGFYKWGWRVFLFGVVLSLCMLLLKQ